MVQALFDENEMEQYGKFNSPITESSVDLYEQACNKITA